MKKLSVLSLLISSVLLLQSCIVDGEVGPQGPAGPPGPQGPAGESGYTFDYENVDFTAPNYDFIIPFDNFEVLPSDVVKVFALWEIDPEVGDIWRPLPQLWFTEFGNLNFNYDFSTADVRMFLEADFDMDVLGPDYTDDWIIRIVVIPSNFQNARINYSDYEAVADLLNLERPDFLDDYQPFRRKD